MMKYHLLQTLWKINHLIKLRELIFIYNDLLYFIDAYLWWILSKHFGDS